RITSLRPPRIFAEQRGARVSPARRRPLVERGLRLLRSPRPRRSPAMFALLVALLALPGQVERPKWSADVVPAAPNDAWMSATGAGALHIGACGSLFANSTPEETHAFLLGAEGAMDVTPSGYSGAMINDSSGLQHVGGVTVAGEYPGH